MNYRTDAETTEQFDFTSIELRAREMRAEAIREFTTGCTAWISRRFAALRGGRTQQPA